MREKYKYPRELGEGKRDGHVGGGPHEGCVVFALAKLSGAGEGHNICYECSCERAQTS